MEARVACACGKVTGLVSEATSRSVNRVVCYCDDCQAFAHHLGRPELLDASGGSDIVQVAPATLRWNASDEMRCVQLGPKGLYRWYSACCRTPLGNTLPNVPFVGMHKSVFGLESRQLDEMLGPPRALILGRFARGAPPAGSTRLSLRFLARTITLVLGWKLRGKAWPHPFFVRETGLPIRTPTVLSKAERDALRAISAT